MVVLAGCQRAPLTDDARPWERGETVSDPALEELLKPDVPVQSTRLHRGADGRFYYVARINDNAPRGYHDRYLQLIQSRGVLTMARSGNPHIIPQRIQSYVFFVFRKGRTRPYTLLHRRFEDTDARWLQAEPLRNLPHPLTLSGRELVFRLGPGALQPWKETILVPDKDGAEVKELPFPRFPGAVLKEVSVPEDDAHLLEHLHVGRTYTTLGARIEEVIDHYERVIEAHGVPVIRPANAQNSLSWWGGSRSLKTLTQVSVKKTPFAPAPGSDITLQTIRELAPDLLQDFPSDAVAFDVFLTFVDAGTAMPYWPAAAQVRWKTLMEGQKVNRK
ncbi:MAG: hypothetical protein L0191_16680 [Acidobacteria bacterium]|nr:hypothetical protein [Acidobacteriota bacterium]